MKSKKKKTNAIKKDLKQIKKIGAKFNMKKNWNQMMRDEIKKTLIGTRILEYQKNDDQI